MGGSSLYNRAVDVLLASGTSADLCMAEIAAELWRRSHGAEGIAAAQLGCLLRARGMRIVKKALDFALTHPWPLPVSCMHVCTEQCVTDDSEAYVSMCPDSTRRENQNEG